MRIQAVLNWRKNKFLEIRQYLDNRRVILDPTIKLHKLLQHSPD